MKVSAVFIDMDSTLLKATNNISRRNMEAIYGLINQGIKVFLATGRHYVSKWLAIKSLLREYRISPNKAVAIGDGPNDIEMLRYVGSGVAMGNDSEKVKAVADFITGHHENDGLSEFIERHLLKS
jgi:hydroxymethylpyrimidine pyrophosphatase-like HAD family hydrolase